MNNALIFPLVFGNGVTEAAVEKALEGSLVIEHFKAGIIAATGGGDTKLDGIVTAGGATPVSYVVVFVNSITGARQSWQLRTGTDAENLGAGIVRPDDYDGATNTKVWYQTS